MLRCCASRFPPSSSPMESANRWRRRPRARQRCDGTVGTLYAPTRARRRDLVLGNDVRDLPRSDRCHSRASVDLADVSHSGSSREPADRRLPREHGGLHSDRALARRGARRQANVCIRLGGVHALVDALWGRPDACAASRVSGRAGSRRRHSRPHRAYVFVAAFPPGQRAEIARVLAIPIACAPMTGPIIGGFFTTVLSWRWIF